MKKFLFVWFGQFISLFGSGITGFALAIWVYQANNSVAEYALASVFITLPHFFLSPIAGIFIDRWNRRWIMIFSDMGAGISTLIIALLVITNHLAIWHIYLLNLCRASCEAFQVPAYVAASTELVSPEQLNRVSGMRQLAIATTSLFCPIFAGLLWETIQLRGILAIDCLTFLCAISILFCLRFPELSRANAKTHTFHFLEDFQEGVHYLISKKGLLSLTIFVVGSRFLMGIVTVLFFPLMLSNYSASILGIMMSLGSIGALFGSLLFSLYQGRNQYVRIILSCTLVSGVCLVATGIQHIIFVYSIALFLFLFAATMTDAANQVILQRKVELHLQGRILSLQMTGMTGAWSIAHLVAGLLADRLFEPIMQIDSPIIKSISQIMGASSGQGIKLMFILMGLITLIVTLLSWQFPPLHNLEKELPSWTKQN